MRMTGFGRGLVVSAVLATAGATGCATSEEWGIWRSNGAHFASLEHFNFSTKNRSGKATNVTRQDIALARDQGWWGKPVTVSQEQILER
jgi:hypothetical protein